MKCKNKHCALISGHPGRCRFDSAKPPTPAVQPALNVGIAAPLQRSTPAPRPDTPELPPLKEPCPRCAGIPTSALATLRRKTSRKLSKEKPWVAEGVSRATWFRDQKVKLVSKP